MPKNPHANFTPVLDGYSGIGAFRFWCQTALPLTYDDSLSYYELLCKVVNYLNHTIEDLTTVEDNTSALAEAYTKLQDYVNDYFDDLDIEAELRNVLDAMAEDGTLDELLSPIVAEQLPGVVDDKIDDVVADQIDDAVAGQIDDSVAEQLPALIADEIPGEVTSWLEENVNPVGSAVVVDSNLTVSGAAADAKVTGDKLNDLKTQLDAIVGDDNIITITPTISNVNVNGVTANYSNGQLVLYGTTSGSRCLLCLNGQHEVKTSTGSFKQTLKPGVYKYHIDYSGATPVEVFLKYTPNTFGSVDNRNLYGDGILKIDVPVMMGVWVRNDILYGTSDNPTFVNITITEIKEAITENTTFDQEYIDTFIPLQNVIGVSRFPNNLMPMGEGQNNVYMDFSTGNIVEGNTNYFITGYIPVEAGKTYKANHGRNHCWFNADKVFVSGVRGTDVQNGILAPSNAAYCVLNVNKTEDGINNPQEIYFAEIGKYDLTVKISGFDVTPWCAGKKINWLGDSIVAGDDFDEFVTQAMKMVETDYGINGSTISLKADGTDARNAICLRYTTMTDDADIIAVSCGTNDFEYAWAPIGDIDSTSNSTFYGALKTLCEGLIAKYPDKIIFFTTPIKRGQPFTNGNGGQYTADDITLTPFSKNKYGKTLGDYANIIKEVCGYYSIPVLDMYNESLLNPSITAQQSMFDNLLTHPTTAGQKIMARRVAGWLMQLAYNVE